MSDAEPGSVLGLVAADGAAAELREPAAPSATDARRVVDLLHRSAKAVATDEQAALADWDEAGSLHDVETLDAVLDRLGGGQFLGGRRRRGLAAGARLALRRSSRVGTARLAAAVLGARGERSDVPTLETLARHPLLTLHAATALAVVPRDDGVAALLRLLSQTEGGARVIVIDRLLAHTYRSAVRLALVRDALVGLPEEFAREVAADIAATCDVDGVLADPKSDEAVLAGARLVRLHA